MCEVHPLSTTSVNAAGNVLNLTAKSLYGYVAGNAVNLDPMLRVYFEGCLTPF